MARVKRLERIEEREEKEIERLLIDLDKRLMKERGILGNSHRYISDTIRLIRMYRNRLESEKLYGNIDNVVNEIMEMCVGLDELNKYIPEDDVTKKITDQIKATKVRINNSIDKLHELKAGGAGRFPFVETQKKARSDLEKDLIILAENLNSLMDRIGEIITEKSREAEVAGEMLQGVRSLERGRKVGEK